MNDTGSPLHRDEREQQAKKHAFFLLHFGTPQEGKTYGPQDYHRFRQEESRLHRYNAEEPVIVAHTLNSLEDLERKWMSEIPRWERIIMRLRHGRMWIYAARRRIPRRWWQRLIDRMCSIGWKSVS